MSAEKMTANLLYENKEWKNPDSYYDSKAITEDLQLHVMFRNSGREQEIKAGTVQTIVEQDVFLENTFSKVLLVPLKTDDEIYYRQEIMKDFFENPELIKSMYFIMQKGNTRWKALGKDLYKKNGRESNRGTLITEIQILQLYIANLAQLKELFKQYDKKIHSKGLRALNERLHRCFSDEFVNEAVGFLEDCSYITEGIEEFQEDIEHQGKIVKKYASIKFSCSLTEGLKMDNLRLEDVSTVRKKVTFMNNAKEKLSNFYTDMMDKETKKISDDLVMVEEAKRLEQQVAEYIVQRLEDFSIQYRDFFEQLYFQTAFYRACFNLYQRAVNIGLPICFPKVCGNSNINFCELVEFSMAMFRKTCPVGNTAQMNNKMMFVITGANQGGKSTFARSVGIAQVMLQCGMFVGAKEFESGIFTHLFTHFTRREDSSMNSGRLDEEMNRMNEIIKNLGEDSFIILNESFATTTEEEGSAIEYGITKALLEAGVKILTVTHLLSYARKLYEENDERVQFLAAERKADGERTFKMIPSKPELTSFGLDLYDKIISGGV